MRVLIAGGHGQIALMLSRELARNGHRPLALIRNPDHAADVRAAGAEPVVLDLEQSSVDEVGLTLDGADAVVFAAGAGPNSGAARKLTVDRDGAILLARAAETAGVRRYVMISALAADGYDRSSSEVDGGEVFQVYLRAKSEADAAIRASTLDWTILRPGGLTDGPGTGRVRLAPSTGRGSIPRADVAALVSACLVDGLAIGVQVEAVGGDVPIAEALRDAR